jgi:YVTN family beta-propeller protein
VRNIGYGANGIVFSGATGYASVTGQPGFLKVFSTTTNKLTGAFGLGTFPEQVAVSPNGSYVAVPNADGFAQGTVHLVQGAHVTEVLAGTQPFACAFTPNGSFLYVTNYNSGASSTVTVIDVASRTVRHQIGVGRGARFVDFNFAGTRAYVANEQSGSVSVINTSTNKVVATVATGGFPYFVTANNARTFVTLRNTGGGVATILQSNNSFVVARTGDKPTFCVTKAKSGSDNEGWVANTGSANVKHFTGTTVNRVLSTGAGTHPLHIAWALNSYNDSGEILYVTLYDQAGKVIAVKPSDDSLLATLSVGPFPKFVAVKP